ncbi:MAG: hypothetical protein SGILL_000110 [Bacillariaceae sp.]
MSTAFSIARSRREQGTNYHVAVVGNNIGLERFISDSRQLGSLMMVFGMCVLVYPQVRTARLAEPELSSDSNGHLDLAVFVGGIIQVVIGIFALIVGFLTTVQDFGSLFLTKALLVVVQLAWMPFLTELANNYNETKENGFIPSLYNPTDQDVRFLGTMGFVGILGWYVGLFGALALIGFTLHAFQSGNPESRNRSYYQSRYIFYSASMMFAGVSQLLVGIYAIAEIGAGPLPLPIRAAMYLVVYPEVAMAVGALQSCMALFGFVRAAGVVAKPNNHLYQCVACFSYLVTVAGTAMAQVYSLPEGIGAGRIPALVVLTLPLHMLLAYLDLKMRWVPEAVRFDYYFNQLSTEEKDAEQPDVDTASDRSGSLGALTEIVIRELPPPILP